uniref:Uncharacterized protein n=1 Tax=Tetraselmis chuii TaxID=63592 RepID=A0A7S1T181_9CHLO
MVAELHEQDLNVTAASNHLHFYANHLLTAFKTCLEKRSHVGHVDKATSGIKAVLTALHLCDHVSVYGVGDSTLESKDIPYQYFTLDGTWSGRVEVSSHHNLSLEEDFLHALARGGIIRHCRYSGCRGDPVA